METTQVQIMQPGMDVKRPFPLGSRSDFRWNFNNLEHTIIFGHSKPETLASDAILNSIVRHTKKLAKIRHYQIKKERRS